MQYSQLLLTFVGLCTCILQATNAKVFDPLYYGAKGDGKTDDTIAVRETLAAAAKNNGGEVLFEKQHSFLTGCFNISSNVILNVKGRIMALKSSSGYEMVLPLPWFNNPYRERQAVIHSYYANNITITGGGTIVGQGAPWWVCGAENGPVHDPPCSGHGSRPHLLLLLHTTDVKIFDITLKDSPSWTLHLANCTNVHIDRATILAPTNSLNTDGIDIDCSVNVLVENSYYDGGDDAIAVKSGLDYNGRIFGRRTENVIVRNMTVGSSDGLSIGSEMSAGVRNVTFQDIIVHAGPKNTSFMAKNQRGINIKSQRGRGGIVEDITYSNIQLHGVVFTIDITLNYHPNLPPTNATATPQFRNIKIDKLVSYDADYGWWLDGIPESYISNVSFSNINLVGTTNLFHRCDFVRGSCSNLTVFPSCPPCMQ